MRKKLIFLASFIITFVLGSIISNETFLGEYYQVINNSGKKVNIPIPTFSYYVKEDRNNTIKFKTLRDFSSAKNMINKYIEFLPSCYDESHFYDKNLDITIMNYDVTNKPFINEITLTYQLGNYCDNEFTLEENWYEAIRQEAELRWAYFVGCSGENSTASCSEKKLTKNDVDEIIKRVTEAESIRIDDKLSVCVHPDSEWYTIDASYINKKEYYNLKIFHHNGYLTFTIIDKNDHAKHAVYDINEDAKVFLKQIFKSL